MKELTVSPVCALVVLKLAFFLLVSPIAIASSACDTHKSVSEETLYQAIYEHELTTLQQWLNNTNCRANNHIEAENLRDAVYVYRALRTLDKQSARGAAERLFQQLSMDQPPEMLALHAQLLAKYALNQDDVKQALALTHLLTSELLPKLSGDALIYAQLATADIHFKIGFFQSVRDLLSPLLTHPNPTERVQAALHLWHTPQDESQLTDVLALLKSDAVLTTSYTLQSRVALVLAKQALEDTQPHKATQLLEQAQVLANQVGDTSQLVAIWLYQAQQNLPSTRGSALTSLNALRHDLLPSTDKLTLTTINANYANEREEWQVAAEYFQQVQTLNNIVTRNKALAREYASFQLIEQAKALESARQQSSLQRLQVERQSQQQVIYLLALICSLLSLAVAVMLFLRKRNDAKRFEHLANTDGLTNVLNRRAIQEYAEQVRRDCEQNNRTFVLALADIDHFKSVNDTYGHDAGDIVLTTFADNAKQLIRQHDAVGRWGGEEWLFVLPFTDISAASGLFERLRNATGQVDIGGKTLSITFSMGAVEANTQSNILKLVNQADSLLYKAKHNGRNQLCT